jgi:hypothetical protein
MRIDYPDVAEAARLLGHAGRVRPKGRHAWQFTCSCGYASTQRRTVPLALDAGVHHVLQAIQKHAATGRPLPSPGDTRPEQVSESRASEVA